MRNRLLKSAILLALLGVSPLCYRLPVTYAHTTTLAVTGGAAPGVSTATWAELQAVTMNNLGSVAFAGRLQHAGPIDAANDAGLWLIDDQGTHLLAQTGAGSVAGVADADFEHFDRPLLSDTGEIVATARLVNGPGGVTTSDDEGVWQFTNATSSLKLRTGSGGVPGLSTTDFARTPTLLSRTNIALAPNGDFAFFNDMQLAVGGVLSTNDRAVWQYTSTDADMLAREGVQGTAGVPEVSGGIFANFTTPRMNSSEQVVFYAEMKLTGSVSTSNRDGIWHYDETTGALVARTGVGNVPGFDAQSYTTFGRPRINEPGLIAFDADLDDPTSSEGIWLYDGATGSLIAATGSAVPGIGDAAFAELTLSGFSAAGQVLVEATLEQGVGGVTSDDDDGLWILNQEETLIARTGIGNVPGVADASFAAFTSATLNEQGQVAFAAELQLGGAVDASNDSGLWIVDPAGESWLVAREGDQLVGRTIESLSFLSDEDEDRGVGFNDIGELAFQAQFTNGDSGLFLFRPYAADFDRDGNVDSDDLDVWQASFSSSAAADGDLDGDSDGSDFLVWQREHGSSGSPQPILAEVPEPVSMALGSVALAIGMSLRRRDRYKR